MVLETESGNEAEAGLAERFERIADQQDDSDWDDVRRRASDGAEHGQSH